MSDIDFTTERKCRVDGCEEVLDPRNASGYCRTHFQTHSPTSSTFVADDPDLRMPAAWANLPESNEPRPDILWAYNNMIHIKRRPGKEGLVYWGRCTTPPSRAAHVQLSFAESNPAAFQQRLDRVSGVTEDSEVKREARRHNVWLLEQIDKVLSEYD